MDKHIERVAKSYDRHIIEYDDPDGLDYDNLPEYITGDPGYRVWKNECRNGREGINQADLMDYLSPESGMEFVHLGCGLGLMMKGYDKWPSNYHGIDISGKGIKLISDYAEKNNIPVGSLHWGSVHDTPFGDNFFHIGDCIGVLEYYGRDFVLTAIKEFRRILKPGARLVLDIPNIESPSGRMMMRVEEYMGRPDLFDMTPLEFEDLIADYFEIVDSDRIHAEKRGSEFIGMAYFYCLKCKP